MTTDTIESPATLAEDVAEIRDGAAIVRLSRTEAGLADLRTELAGKTYDLTTTKGDKAARSDRLRCVTLRTDVEKLRKKLKAPVLEFGRRIDAEAARITAEVEKLEAPIDAAIRADEKRRADEKAEIERLEAERLRGLVERVGEIMSGWVERCNRADMTAERVEGGIEALRLVECPAELADVADQFEREREAAARHMQSIADDLRRRAEAERQRVEAARLAAERAELERQRAEAEAAAQAERDRLAAEAQAQAAELARQRAEIEAEAARVRATAEQLERERREREEANEREAQAAAAAAAAAQAQAERIALDNELTGMRAEAAALAAAAAASLGAPEFALDPEPVDLLGDTPSELRVIQPPACPAIAVLQLLARAWTTGEPCPEMSTAWWADLRRASDDLAAHVHGGAL